MYEYSHHSKTCNPENAPAPGASPTTEPEPPLPVDPIDRLRLHVSDILHELSWTNDYTLSVIRAHAQQHGTSLEGFRQVRPAIDTQAKLAKEIEKYAKFDLRMQQM